MPKGTFRLPIRTGGVAVDKSAVTIYNQTFGAGSTNFTLIPGGTGGAAVAGADGILITNTGVKVAGTAGAYGATKSGMTIVEVDYGVSGLNRYLLIPKFKVVSAPAATTAVFGFGRYNRGEKTPLVHGAGLIGYSTVESRAYLDDLANDGLVFDSPLAVDDEIEMYYKVWDGQAHIQNIKATTLQGRLTTNVYEVRSVANGSTDPNGRVGSYAAFVWGCQVKLVSVQVIDLSQKATTLILTHSWGAPGWSGVSSNTSMGIVDTARQYSGVPLKHIGAASATFKDYYTNLIAEITAGSFKNIIVMLTTNEYLMAKSTATVQAEYTTGLAALKAIPGIDKVAVCMMPNVNGVSIATFNAAVSAAATAVGGIDICDLRPYLESNPTTWLSGMSIDKIHPSIAGCIGAANGLLTELPTYF